MLVADRRSVVDVFHADAELVWPLEKVGGVSKEVGAVLRFDGDNERGYLGIGQSKGSELVLYRPSLLRRRNLRENWP